MTEKDRRAFASGLIYWFILMGCVILAAAFLAFACKAFFWAVMG